MSKEYRIKAKSPEHRKAIIGALEGLGLNGGPEVHEDDYGSYPSVMVFPSGEIDLDARTSEGTHTSLDEMIDDIIRDRETVEMRLDACSVMVSRGGVLIDGETAVCGISLADFDQIAEAVKKVRGQ